MLSIQSFISRSTVAILAMAVTGLVNGQSTEKPISRFAIGASAGTTGYGPVASFTASKNFTITAGYSMLDVDFDYEDDDGDYTANLDMKNFDVLLNWHPFAGNFHITAGAVIGDSEAMLVGVPKAGNSYNIGGRDYTAQEVGTLTGSAPLIDGTVPYVGIGWSKTPAKRGLGFFFDIGVLFIDAPVVNLSADGTMSSHPLFQKDLKKETDELNADLADYEYYPVVKLGLFYRF